MSRPSGRPGRDPVLPLEDEMLPQADDLARGAEQLLAYSGLRPGLKQASHCDDPSGWHDATRQWRNGDLTRGPGWCIYIN